MPLDDPSLTGGGDCFSHWHSSDRQPTHDFLAGLQGVVKVKFPTTSYSVDILDDFHLVNTTGGVVTATLPPANSNRLITFVRTAGASKVTLVRSGTNTVNGTTSLDITSSYSPVRLLALKGVGYVQV